MLKYSYLRIPLFDARWVLAQAIKRSIVQKRFFVNRYLKEVLGLVHQFYKKNVFINLLISYIIVFMVVLVVSGLFYTQTYRGVRESTLKLSTQSLQDFSINIDRNIQNITQFSRQLGQSITSDLKENPDLLFAKDNFREMQRILQEYSLYNNFIDYFFITIENSGSKQILSSQGWSDAETFYYTYHINSPISQSDWLNLMFETTAPKFIIMPTKDLTDGYLAYILPIRGEYSNLPDFTVVSYVSSVKFFQNITESNSFYAVKNYDDSIFYLTEESQRPFAESFFLDEQPQQEYTKYKYDGNSYIICEYPSSAYTWTYYQFTDSASFWGYLQKNWLLFLLNHAICIILGLIVAYYFSMRNYTPISKIISLLPSDLEKETKNRNEYTIIADSINKMTSAARQLRRLANSTSNALKQMTLERILYNYVNPNVSVDELLAQQGLSFPYQYFYVGCFSVLDYSSLFPGDSSTPEKPEEVVHFLIENVLNDIFPQKNNANTTPTVLYECVEMHDFLTVIFNTTSSSDEDILSILSQIITFFDQEMQVTISATLSSQQNDITNLHSAFSECMSSIYPAASTSSPNWKTSTYYKYDKSEESKLLQYISIGETENAQEQLRSLLDTPGLMPFDATKCYLYDILTSIFRSLNNEAIQLMQQDMVKSIITSENYDELLRYSMECIKRLSMYYQSNNTRNADHLLSDVCKYIEENYRDPNLCVSAIGDHFHKNPAYLSRTFRNAYHINLSDYIANYKINKSLDLIKNTTMSVKEISDFLGYSNSNVFIRTFKKITGITPSKYKLTSSQNSGG